MVADRESPGRREEDPYLRERTRMVRDQIAARGIRDTRILAAMQRVPRHRFVPPERAREAYGDHPVPIGDGQTVSQPYIIAYMIDALGLAAGARVLEIGTGSGYQAAVLAEAGFRVWSIEVRSRLAIEAAQTLRALGYDSSRVALRCGDGMRGWPEAAPFDGILGAAAAPTMPSDLLEQLAPGGCMILPIGDEHQVLWRYQRTLAGFRGEELIAVRFVPMVSDEADAG